MACLDKERLYGGARQKRNEERELCTRVFVPPLLSSELYVVLRARRRRSRDRHRLRHGYRFLLHLRHREHDRTRVNMEPQIR